MMSLLTQRTTLLGRCLVRRYAVSRANPRPKDPVLNSANAKVQQVAPDTTFIHNPPSSVPTPHSLTTAPASPLLSKPGPTPEAEAEAERYLPPELRPKRPVERTRLTQAQMEEMRRLRLSDPKTHSCQALARRFGCSAVFVSMVAPLPKEKRQELEREQNAAQGQWGERKTLMREIRKQRRKFW